MDIATHSTNVYVVQSQALGGLESIFVETYPYLHQLGSILHCYTSVS